MKIVNISNYFNHLQKPLADSMYRVLGDDYKFIEITGVPEFRKKLGYQELKAPYVLNYKRDGAQLIEKLIEEADCVIYGEAPLDLVKKRYREGKLVFRDDECRYKSVSRFLKWPIYTYNSLFLNKGYLLCASAYGPIDYYLSGINPKKCFRWGYFPEVKHYASIDELFEKKSQNKKVKIMWAGRLIPLKHPEYTIYAAEKLKEKGYSFEINIVGGGSLEEKLKKKTDEKKLNDVIHFLGSMPPERVRSYMEESDIYLVTSDRNEGWGAVLNESMNSGCAVVAGSNIGAAPYLVKDGMNGIIFKSDNKKDFCDKVEYLLSNSALRLQMGKAAYETILNVWNGEKAAENFISLCESILAGKTEFPIKDGPCSHAPLLMRTWRGKFKVL